jgi:hypothetical protein
MVLLSGR